MSIKTQRRLCLALCAVCIIMATSILAVLAPSFTAEAVPPTPTTSAPTERATEPTERPTEPTAPATEPTEPEPYFYISDADRELVERVVTAEAIGEPFEGQKAVAQCILETARATGKTPGEVVSKKGQYATPAKAERVTQSVRDAVAAIFDRGELVTHEPIRYFYAPARCESKWHESLPFVIEIGGHRFFKEG